MKKYFIITYGCQMNHSDSERIAGLLKKSGWKRALKIEKADLILVNMCSIRQSAVDRVYGFNIKIKKLRSSNPKIIFALTGCILKNDKKKFESIFNYIFNIKDLPEFIQALKAENLRNSVDSLLLNGGYLKINPEYSNKFSINIPIMTGCNNYCSYCVVPYLRGREISRPAKEIISEIKKAVKNGAKEIWILGQNVNSYKDPSLSGKIKNFSELLKKADEIPGNFWIRFTSSHPKDFSDDLIKVMAEAKKITPYLNLPVQAGNDKMLKKMNRPYTIKKYKNIVKKVRKAIPEITLSTDIIVGFPSETKKEFENSIKLFKEMKFDMAYISQYSKRYGTAAYKMNDNVSKKEKKERAKKLTKILEKTALENNKKLIGKELKSLINSEKNGYYFGKTENYKTIKIKSDKNILGKFVKIKITNAFPWGLSGKIIK